MVIYDNDGATTIVFENGTYVFMLDGTCEQDLLRKIIEEMTAEEES